MIKYLMESEQVGCSNVKIQDNFWDKKMHLIQEKVLPYQWQALNDNIKDATPSYCIKNFRLAADMTEGLDISNREHKQFKGLVFQDSDVAKWIEAVAYCLTWHEDEQLEATVDEVIDLICRAQQADGYLNTYYIINGLEKRFTNLTDNHELYCLGHMIEAACAYYHASKKRKLLDAMIRYVDLVDRIFGPEEEKQKGYPGHPVVELALVRLYEITGNEKHLKLAKYFIDQRGQQPLYFSEEAKRNNNGFYWKDSNFKYAYYQAHQPVREQETAIGHAVRAVYLYSGMTDVARITQDQTLIDCCETLWNNIYTKQMYITGAIGASAYGEAFTFDYDLPNDLIYGETCASIGLVFFAIRILRMRPRRQYADAMEMALYNGIISGISLDGTRFFYVNPLEVLPEAIEKNKAFEHVKGERQKWFGCACCPPNVARMLSSLGDYIYTKNDTTVWQHLYIGSKAEIEVGQHNVCLNTETSYPWDEKVLIKVSAPEGVGISYACRIPSWCSEWKVMLNNKPAVYEIRDGYAYLKENVMNDDCIELVFSMPVAFVKSNPKVRQNVGKSAVMRGPIVYCLEEADNGKDLGSLHLGNRKNINRSFEEELEGIVSIMLEGEKESGIDELYYTSQQVNKEEKLLRFIPYYTWANRELGEMIVWIND